jgi:hypothetical protein
MTWLAVLVLQGTLVAVGRGWIPLFAAPGAPGGAGHRLVLSALAGLLWFDIFTLLASIAGLPWHPAVLAAGLGLGFFLPRWLFRKRPVPLLRLASDWGWGDAVAAFALAAFALLALSLIVANPDFVFHWGFKGAHFHLARGIDWPFLAEFRNWQTHPDYPNLLPALYGASAILGGRFEPAALMLWSVGFFALLLLSLRETLRQGLAGRAGGRWMQQASTAIVATTVATFAIGYLMAGAADLMPALALAAALPALLQKGPGARRQLAIAAAFAAASKMEGLPLAAFLLLATLPGDAGDRPGRRRRFFDFVAPGLPTLAVVLPWAVQVRRWHLQQPSNFAAFDPGRIPEVFAAITTSLSAPELHFLPWLILLVFPLWLVAGSRRFAAVATVQLAFYLWAYLASVLPIWFYVLSSCTRLFFHLIPAVLTVALLALVGGGRDRLGGSG